MEAWKEAELLARIRGAVTEAFPPRLAQALVETIDHWYTWSARNDPSPLFGPPCGMCRRLLPSAYAEPGGRFGICRECRAALSRLARDPEWPLRDMAQAYAVRAMGEDPQAAAFLQRLASLYPDFRRLPGPCSLCAADAPTLGADHARLCDRCRGTFGPRG